MGTATRSWFVSLSLLSLQGCFGTSAREVDASVFVEDASETDGGVDARAVPSDRCGSSDPSVRSLCAMAIVNGCRALGLVRPLAPDATVETRECLIRAGADCDAVADCIGSWIEPSTEACGEYCDGDIRVRCDGTWRVREECGRIGPGNHCFAPTPEDPHARCSTASCIAAPSSSCTPDGNIENCNRWSDRTVSMCPSDTPCAPANGFLDCTGRGPRCMASRCASSGRMIPCVNGQEGTPIDCGEGQVCGADGICNFIEVPLCMSSSSTLTCDGADLVYCNLGESTRISCTQLGFSSCGYFERTFIGTCR